MATGGSPGYWCAKFGGWLGWPGGAVRGSRIVITQRNGKARVRGDG
jgi:hypothetical protein